VCRAGRRSNVDRVCRCCEIPPDACSVQASARDQRSDSRRAAPSRRQPDAQPPAPKPGRESASVIATTQAARTATTALAQREPLDGVTARRTARPVLFSFQGATGGRRTHPVSARLRPCRAGFERAGDDRSGIRRTAVVQVPSRVGSRPRVRAAQFARVAFGRVVVGSDRRRASSHRVRFGGGVCNTRAARRGGYAGVSDGLCKGWGRVLIGEH
jgi:hypothetical protein